MTFFSEVALPLLWLSRRNVTRDTSPLHVMTAAKENIHNVTLPLIF